MKKVSVFGATGSIGAATIEVLAAYPDRFRVKALVANSSFEKLAECAERVRPEFVAIADKTKYIPLKERLSDTDCIIGAGEEAVMEAAGMEVEVSVHGIVGMKGLKPLLKAIENSDVVAVANKEPLVSAGRIIQQELDKNGTKLVPLDSEHNAVFQVFETANAESIETIILTSSGGPFREMPKAQMVHALPEQALKHPNFIMGAKISIDSATLMNKALEIIEASVLFDKPGDKIEVLIHPEQIIHSMVSYADGSILAQLGSPDMRTPITYALGWPKRLGSPGRKLLWSEIPSLNFEKPDKTKFPSLDMAYTCLQSGEEYCLALNAANEVAVENFLKKKISFGSIFDIIRNTLEELNISRAVDIENVIEQDNYVRQKAQELLSSDNANRIKA